MESQQSWGWERRSHDATTDCGSSSSVRPLHLCQWPPSFAVCGPAGGSLLDVTTGKESWQTKKREDLSSSHCLCFCREKKKQATCFFYTSAHFPCKFKCTVLISKFTRFCRYCELLFSIIKKRIKWCDIISLTVLTFTK